MVHTISGGRRWQIDVGSPDKTTSEGKAPNQNLTPNTSSTAQGGGGSFKNRKPIGQVGCCESGMAERIH